VELFAVLSRRFSTPERLKSSLSGTIKRSFQEESERSSLPSWPLLWKPYACVKINSGIWDILFSVESSKRKWAQESAPKSGLGGLPIDRGNELVYTLLTQWKDKKNERKNKWENARKQKTFPIWSSPIKQTKRWVCKVFILEDRSEEGEKLTYSFHMLDSAARGESEGVKRRCGTSDIEV